MEPERYCPSCGRANALTARYCSNCGQMLAAGQVLLQKPPDSFFEEDTITENRWRSATFRDSEEATKPEVLSHIGPETRQTVPRYERRSATSPPHAVSTSDPATSALLSFFFPGVGQICAKQVSKGLLLVSLAFIAVRFLQLGPFEMMMIAGRVLVALDAYNVARRRRAGRRVGEWDWYIQDPKKS